MALDASSGVFSPLQEGAYDLSGAVYDYAHVPGLVAAAQGVGLRNWRVGLGRWEIGSELFPSVPGPGGAMGCPAPYFANQLSVHPTLDALLAERDFFQLTVDHGTPGAVDLADLEEPLNYHFDYLDRVLAQADAFGFEPYLNIDIIPRILAQNRVPVVTDCGNTFRNGVSTSPPLDNNVYAYTVVRVVDHVLTGWPNNGTPHALRYVEIGNEPDALGNFWSGTPAQFNAMYVAVSTALANVRAMAPAGSAWKQLKVGGGSFAFPPGRTGVTSPVPGFLQALDAAPGAALDFLSMHSYWDDEALIVVDQFNTRAEVLNASHGGRWSNTELLMSEWGPDLGHLGDQAYNRSMQAPLVVGFGLLGAHALRFTMTHKALFYDMYFNATSGVGFYNGLVDAQAQVSPAGRVYQLLTDFMATPNIIDFPAVYPATGTMDGLVIAGSNTTGNVVQVAAVNRSSTPRMLSLNLTGRAAFQPVTAVARILDGDGSALRTVQTGINRSSGVQVLLPARSVMLVTLQ